MNANGFPTPEDISAYNDVFVKALSDLNEISLRQLNMITEMALHVLEKLTAIKKINPSDLADESKHVPEDARQALKEKEKMLTADPNILTKAFSSQPDSTTSTNEDGRIETDFPNSLLQALSNAYQNAVTIQQQTNITASAATTLFVTTIVDTDFHSKSMLK